MKWWALFLLLAAPPAFAAQPFARAVVEESEGVVPGQQVHVIVDVFAPDFFTAPPQFPLFDMPDALVTLPDDRAQNMVQTVDGQQYSGIRRIYAIVPEKAGSFTVPNIHIPLGWSVDGKPTTGEVVATSVRFNVASGGDAVFAAKGVDISQSFDRDPAKLKAGGALVRTIVVTARETQGLTMPAVDVGTAAGLQQYVKPPKIEDGVQFGRGDTGTRRTETIVYTTDRVGGFTIPPVAYAWFDIDTHQESTASLPAINVAVASAATSEGIAIAEPRNAVDPVSQRRKVMLFILSALAMAAIVWSARRLPSETARVWNTLRERRRVSRRDRLRHLCKVIRTAAPSEVYAALQAWSRAEGYRTVDGWLSDRSPGLATEVYSLEKRLFSDGTAPLDRRRIVSLLRQASVATSKQISALAPLNPSIRR